jgi:hypothetical protein
MAEEERRSSVEWLVQNPTSAFRFKRLGVSHLSKLKKDPVYRYRSKEWLEQPIVSTWINLAKRLQKRSMK